MKPLDHLTPREMDVIRQVADGKQDKEISLALGISLITVRNHLYIARQKLNLSNRTQLAVYALRKGLVQA